MLMRMLPTRARLGRQRGLSIVELMVGIAVGLFIVAAAATLTSAQLTDNRKLLAETQLQQDLRATLDIITRELRRTNHFDGAVSLVPKPTSTGVAASPFNSIDVTSTEVNYRYLRSSGSEAFGFRLNTNGSVSACQAESTSSCSSGWQELTDLNTIEITGLSFATVRAGTRARVSNNSRVLLPCDHLCADDSTNCWPTVRVQELTVSITGRSRADHSVERTLSSSVRVRADDVSLSNEAPAGQSCPAG